MKALAVTALAALALVGGPAALAATHHHAATKTLKVVMHDPGCHWFLVHGKDVKTASISRPVRLLDLDEAALKVASHSGTKVIPVGKSVVLDRGHYVVMMVGQAVDDNYLKLTVR